MHFPRIRSLMNPQRVLRGLGTEVAGVLALGVTQKYVPNVYARWGCYALAAAAGAWYPITRAVLTVTNLDEVIESITGPQV